MNWKLILKIQGFLLIILASMMVAPLAFALYYRSSDIWALSISMLITLALGTSFILAFKSQKRIGTRESFVSVSMGWILASVFGALPFYLHGSFGPYIDCVFEAMSGFTTTGATILTDIEAIPKGLLFWRSLTHWLGGMGIVLLTIAVLPTLGMSPGLLYRAEVPGPIKDRLKPKIKDTAKILWLIYLFMTLLETLLLMVGGMNLYDALCHTFGTLATGGFSTYSESVGGFKSTYIEVVIIIFMYLAGINFTLHFYLVQGRLKDFFKDREWKFYTGVLVTGVVLISLNLYFSELPLYNDSYMRSLRDSAFQVVSITTTTGYTTADFNLWPSFSSLLLVFLMFLGGSAGSTGGGIKQIRVLIILKHLWHEVKKLVYPRAVFSLKVGDQIIDEDIVKNVLAFFMFFILFFAGITLFLAFQGYDIVTSFSASIATLGNIGPGLARVGAVENYSFFDPYSKLLLIFAMLLGRLEIFSVLILMYSLVTRKR
ncbi:Trk system potassium transporter TrkH [Propionigenium maris DSM 9537]|uniref:Trk system potassium transporter TrkH n=1 Tax=Propionigenium maris DSM 9537 TaxID=1123000 RepID=A0A9W6LM53_9FUSO|nr:TrkH family potassium uptake protein [Propionigenium maris]GLI55083.1 Trk system potassium transporter TrkH [Propionigenium maris DSM 9537]